MDGGASRTDEPFAALGALAAACAAVDVVELSDGEVLDAVLGLSVVVGQVESVLAQATASLGARSLHALDQARSVASWIAVRTELSHGRAKALVASGRALLVCPHVEVAYRRGDLGSSKVEAMVAVREGVEALFAEHEAELVEQVRPLTVRQARTVLNHWRLLALASLGQDGDGPRPGEDESLNSLHVSATFLGRFRVDGTLDVVTGKRLAEALEAERDARFRSGEWSHDDGLTASQRNAIILADILDGIRLASQTDAPETDVPGADAAAGAGAGRGGPRAAATRGGRARPAISILWDAKDLLGEAADGVADALYRRCVLGEDHPLGRSVAERLMCDADVTDVLVHFGADGKTTPLGVAHTRRYPTPDERAALVVRDGGCVFPGCDTPARWADAHHTVPYEREKRTALHEMVLLCRRHHKSVHEGGYTLWRTPDDGHIHVLDPDGHPMPEAARGEKLPPPPPPERRPKTVFKARPPDHGRAA